MFTTNPPPTLHIDLDALAEGPVTLAALSERLTVCAANPVPHEMVEALGDVARCYFDQGALPSAEAHFEQALRWSELLGSIDGQVDLLCEAAEVAATTVEQSPHDPRARRAARRRAVEHANEAARLAARVADPAWEVKVLLRASDVLDRCGHTTEASELQARAMLRMASLSSR